MLTDLLRGELHYSGIVFTDAMSMKGVTNSFPNGEASVLAVEAGADILVLPPDVPAAFNAIKAAVASGRITEGRIDQSVRRILSAKASLNLQDPRNRFTDVNKVMTTVGSKPNRDLAQRISDAAITLVRDDSKVLPLRASNDLRVVQINLLDSRTGWREGVPGKVMTAELPKRFPRAVTVQVDDLSTPAELDMVRKLAQLADTVVVNGYIRVAAYKGSIDLTSAQTSLLKDLIALKKPMVYTSFGSPYVLTHIAELPSYVVAYDTSITAEMAAVRAMTGEIEYRGKLPISLPGLYPVGHGLSAR